MREVGAVRQALQHSRDRARPIVVGFDGSPQSGSALRWAAEQARVRGAPLQVLSAQRSSRRGSRGATVHRLTREVCALSRRHPGLSVGAQMPSIPAVDALVNVAREAALIVVGSRGIGHLPGVFESVSTAVCARADCPVAVVRDEPVASSGPVLVGVDGSPEARAAVEYGLRAARLTGRGLRVLRAVDLPRVLGISVLETALDPHTEQHLRDELRAWMQVSLSRFPGVRTDLRVAAADPVTELIEQSRTASLTVVGSRGSDGLSALLLGSVRRELVRRAHSPVLVLRTDRRQPETVSA